MTRTRAHHLIEIGRHETALTLVARLLAEAPDDPGLHQVHAQCLVGLGQHWRALRAAERAVAAAPHAEFGHRLRAVSLTALGRHEEAVVAATESVRLAPNLALAHIAFADAARYLPAHRHQALEAARRAVALAPDDADAHVTLGLVAADMQNRNLARQSYRRALALDPDDATAINNLAGTVGWWRTPTFGRGIASALRVAPHDDVILENVDVLARRWLLGILLSATVAFVLGLVVTHLEGRTGVSGASLGILGVLAALIALQTWLLQRSIPWGMRRHLHRRLRSDTGLRTGVLFPAVAVGAAVVVCAVPGGAAIGLMVVQALACLAVVVAAFGVLAFLGPGQ